MAEAGEVEAALDADERLDLDGYHYFHSTRAELLRGSIASRTPAPPTTRALELVHSDAERRFLERRLAGLPA